MGPWMQGREVPRRALSASVGESSLELQLSNSLELGCIDWIVIGLAYLT